MNKSNFISDEMVEKENAVKYFPEFFTKDLNISSKYNLEDLKLKYLEYCERYFTNPSNYNADDRVMVIGAYDYMKKIMKIQKEFSLQNDVSKKVLNTYEKLILTVSHYSFIIHWENSYGQKQNKTNKQILLEISMFKPAIIKTLENVDKYLKKIDKPEKIDSFYIDLIGKLESLVDELVVCNERLLQAQNNYHVTWDSTMRPEYNEYPTSYHELGERKKEWRQMRNKTLHSILSFYEEINNINHKVCHKIAELNDSKYNEENTDDVDQLYNYTMRKIVSSPNYYCYLNNEERENFTKQNKIKKLQLKNKD